MTTIDVRLILTILAALVLLLISVLALREPILDAMAWTDIHDAMSVAAHA